MSFEVNGELCPVGGGDNIPLIRPVLTLGRRESCDICMRFPNVSGLHCELNFRNGYWYIKDCGSTNGVKVNNVRVQEKLLHPKDEITIAKKRYVIQYELPSDHRTALLEDQEEEDILSTSLLEKAGLEKPQRDPRRGKTPKKTAHDDALDYLLGDDQ
jgi:adenylate cyclase